MRILVLATAALLFGGDSYALSFGRAVELIGNHHKTQSFSAGHSAAIEDATRAGSIGDPSFKLALKNYPKDTLKNDQTPMTSMEFMVAQKLPLTTKLGNIEDSKRLIAQSLKDDGEQFERDLIRNLWVLSIEKRKLEEQQAILKRNISWVDKMLKVSKKLYANGKTTQQALFDLNIRRSEIESSIEKVKYSLKALDAKTFYLTGVKGRGVDIKTVPWELLRKRGGDSDYREKSLRSKKASSELMARAQSQALVPDVTLSLSYNKRADIDGNGDFVGASLSFPLPFSGQKYASRREAIEKRRVAESELKNYLNYKESELDSLATNEERIRTELSILSGKSIGFARNSLNISSRSYGHGSVGYVELLSAELKLQELLLKKTELSAQLDKNRLNQKFLRGDTLHEN